MAETAQPSIEPVEPLQTAEVAASYTHFDLVGVFEGDVLDANDEVVLTTSNGFGDVTLTTWTPSGDYLGEVLLPAMCGTPTLSPGIDSTIYVPELIEQEAEGLQEAAASVDIVAYDKAMNELWRHSSPPLSESEVSDFFCVEINGPLLRLTDDGLGLSYELGNATALLLGLGAAGADAPATPEATDATSDGTGTSDDVSERLGVSGDSDRTEKVVSWTPVPLGNYWGTYSGLCANCLNNLQKVDIVDPMTFEVLATHSDGAIADGGIRKEGTALQLMANLAATTSPEDSAAVFLPDGHTAVVADGPLRTVDILTGDIVSADRSTGSVGRVWLVGDDLLVTDSGDFANVQEVRGYDLMFNQLWAQGGANSVCHAQDGQAVVAANDQWALLSAETGEQLDFTDQLGSCNGSNFGAFFSPGDGELYRTTDSPS